MTGAPVLGPLEWSGDRWTIGDPTARRAQYLTLEPEGLAAWEDGSRTEVVPWRRFMELHLSAEPTRLGNSRTLAVFANIVHSLNGTSQVGGGPAGVGATLRHPYEYWGADFSHHARRYSRYSIDLVSELLAQTVASARPERLGDPAWVRATVTALAPLRGGFRGPRARTVVAAHLNGSA
ncbi:hypothetical protein ACGFX4_07395 [Kitasatospora sp. NPDC048365]|uniref:hypothetical protein n=1 Tax=Kitasatospora sp. NPDC048365 TaxID=3364050 RepID=UPI003718C7B6